METYIGAKIILDEPEKKDGQDGYRVVYADNYVSWSPKEVFEEAYRPISLGEINLIHKGEVSIEPES